MGLLDAIQGWNTQVEDPEIYEKFFDKVVSDSEKGPHLMSDKNHDAYMRVLKEHAHAIKLDIRKLRLEGKPNTDLHDAAVAGVNKILAAVQPIFADEANQNREMLAMDKSIEDLRVKQYHATNICVGVMTDFGPETLCHRIPKEPLRAVDDVVRGCIAAEDEGTLPKGACSEAFVSALRHVPFSEREVDGPWFQLRETPESDEEPRPAGLMEMKQDSFSSI